ncbi:aldo/keto reductase [Nocardia takedensis]|uniref:aldo/keto reductase n=1 Tax=Nocardia takedensis TaxID=259390 RepID=UPI0002E37A0A|nr:aldo/keto reductase [Nocardia takedensis]
MGESSSPRRVGNSGLAVSVVGLGTNNFGMKLDLEQSRAVVHAALDHGITLIDTADSYGDSEQRIGEILQGKRDDVVIATKFGNDVRRLGQDNGADWGARGSRRYIRRAVEQSLRRLRTDWIDLYQYHRPDPATPIEETLSALDDLVREGKIRYLGHSNFTGWQTADAEWTARTRDLERFVSAQNEYSLLQRGIEADLVPALEQYRIGLLPFFPLASGLLTGKYKRGAPAPQGSRIQAWGRESVLTDATFDVIEQLEEFAAQRSITLLEVAIGGLAAQPAVSSVIAGATSPEQVEANVRAGQWRPTPEDLAEIDRITASPRA